MITMLGSPRHCCDGITRRETLKAGALSFLGGGFTLPNLLRAEQAKQSELHLPRKAKSVMFLFLLGGAATQDMIDLKPTAPKETGGEFKPISTKVPGIQVCEHLPKMATWMDRIALVRSLSHKAGCHNCLPAYTGNEELQPDQHPKDSHPPSMGSVCEWLKRSGDDLPAYVYMPCWLGWGQAFRRGGPYAGFLGKKYDPLYSECTPYSAEGDPKPSPGKPNVVRGMPRLADTNLATELTLDRLQQRRGLLTQFDDQLRRAETQPALSGYDRIQQKAFGLLTGAKVRSAFDLTKEDPRMLDRYGRTLFGHSCLIGRRLVESGVRFVNVTWDLFWDRHQVDYDAWDTHTKNFEILKGNKLPNFDQTYTALLEDLQSRGLLDETLVVVMSEMGRTPRVNGNAGRDHWTHCYGMWFAGAGIKGGAFVGASDPQAAYVKDRPVSSADICATIYQLLGIDPDMPVYDKANRPVAVALGGKPIHEVLA